MTLFTILDIACCLKMTPFDRQFDFGNQINHVDRDLVNNTAVDQVAQFSILLPLCSEILDTHVLLKASSSTFGLHKRLNDHQKLKLLT